MQFVVREKGFNFHVLGGGANERPHGWEQTPLSVCFLWLLFDDNEK